MILCKMVRKIIALVYCTHTKNSNTVRKTAHYFLAVLDVYYKVRERTEYLDIVNILRIAGETSADFSRIHYLT